MPVAHPALPFRINGFRKSIKWMSFFTIPIFILMKNTNTGCRNCSAWLKNGSSIRISAPMIKMNGLIRSGDLKTNPNAVPDAKSAFV